MIDVSKLIISTMKGEIFSSTPEEKAAARQVLAEMKTKYIDIREEITSAIQYKLLTKMANDRSKAAEIYKSAGREDMYAKEMTEYSVIKSLIAEVEKDLPKQMSEEDILNKIKEIAANQSPINIGLIMKAFKELPADKSLVSKLAKEFILNATTKD